MNDIQQAMEHLHKNIELPEPWYWTSEDLTDQLKKEIGKSHILYGKNASTLARRQDRDDVLFLIDKDKFAVIHLTWSNNPHLDGHWPTTLLYETWKDLYRNRILVDKAEFQ